jgi:hypothetical protein
VRARRAPLAVGSALSGLRRVDAAGEEFEGHGIQIAMSGATGNGFGYGIVSAIGRSDNTFVWACVVAITASSLLLYGLASVLERMVRRRWGG